MEFLYSGICIDKVTNFNEVVNFDNDVKFNRQIPILSDKDMKCNVRNKEASEDKFRNKSYLYRLIDVPIYTYSYKNDQNKLCLGYMAQDIDKTF